MFKTRLDTFGNDFGLFWNFEKFFIFLKIFEDSTLHGTLLGTFRRLDPPWNTWQKKSFRKKFQNTFGHNDFWNFEKKVFEKINPKHVQNTFGHFWERFWAFLEF